MDSETSYANSLRRLIEVNSSYQMTTICRSELYLLDDVGDMDGGRVADGLPGFYPLPKYVASLSR